MESQAFLAGINAPVGLKLKREALPSPRRGKTPTASRPSQGQDLSHSSSDRGPGDHWIKPRGEAPTPSVGGGVPVDVCLTWGMGP